MTNGETITAIAEKYPAKIIVRAAADALYTVFLHEHIVDNEEEAYGMALDLLERVLVHCSYMYATENDHV